MDKNELLSPIFIGLYSIKYLHEANHASNIEKYLIDVSDSINELKSRCKMTNYDQLVKAVIKQYKKDIKPDKVSDYQIRFIESPLSFDILNFRREKYVEFISYFITYWDVQISYLKMKSAIIKRRNYLIEQCDLMINILKSYSYNDLIIKLEDFKIYQKSKLEE